MIWFVRMEGGTKDGSIFKHVGLQDNQELVNKYAQRVLAFVASHRASTVDRVRGG